MSEAEKKRVRRSAEQRAAETDAKIAELHTSVEQLETKKKAAAAAFDEKIASVQARIKALEAKKAEIPFRFYFYDINKKQNKKTNQICIVQSRLGW